MNVFEKIVSFIRCFVESWTMAHARGSRIAQNRFGAGMVGKLIGLSIGVFIMVYTVPPAISALYNVSVATWGTEVGTLFTVLVPLIIIIAVVIVVLKYAGINVSM